MKYNKLGKTDIIMSELGFGCASIFGKTFFDSEKAISLCEKAFELGINFFDTGFSYNDSEVRLGQFIQRLGLSKRNHLVIATKCGTRISSDGKYYHDWRIDWLKESLENSLKRLNTDHVELLHLHGPQIKDMSDDVLHLLDDFKAQGIVKAVGVNSFDTEVLNFICEQKFFDFVMLDYNIMRQDREPLIANLAEAGIGVIGGAALAQSLYSNRIFKIRGFIDIWYLLRALKNWRHHIIAGFKYRFINECHSISGNQIALRYVLDNPNVASSVFGTSSIEHMVENIQATDLVMPEEIREKICRNKYDSQLLDRK